jgi:ubiquinone/menaquinone biosynthesis C-methylase UbiE
MSNGNIGGVEFWDGEIEGSKIPGAASVPIKELKDFFGTKDNLIGLDLGSGQGRSTSELRQFFPNSKIVALDLSSSGLQLTNTEYKTQAKAERLPFENNAFDFINVCGVMTNIVDKDPVKAQDLRHNVMNELFRTIKPEGCVVISDFGSEHLLDNYYVNYERHKLITKEYGTIAVLKTGENFTGKTNAEVAAIADTDKVERFAHHYTNVEMRELLTNVGFKVEKFSICLATTPNGKNKIDNLIFVAVKPNLN